MSRPSAYNLWKQAGGGTDRFDRDEYRRLMREHGLLIPLNPGETAEPLPCGWPHHTPETTRKETVMPTMKTPHPDAGKPFVHPDLPDFLRGVVGYCGHRVAESEWRAGLHTCERCPASDYEAPGER